MNKNEVKDFFLSNLNLDQLERAMVERFFVENDGITLGNFDEMYDHWIKSDAGQKACYEEEQKISAIEYARMKKGLTSIDKGNYTVLSNTHRLRTCVVEDSETNLYGLITDDKKEILPCIFTGINVTLDGFIEVAFKGYRYSFYFNPKGFAAELKSLDEKELKEYFLYAETETYCIAHEDGFDYEGNNNSVEQKLFDLLNVNHRVK